MNTRQKRELLRDFDQGYLKSILTYDPSNGIFTWRHRPSAPAQWNVRYAGEVAGRTNINRRRPVCEIKIDGKLYLAHRLAWLYMTGDWPPNEIDHRDTDSLNNRWNNLRRATRSQNNSNVGPQKNNSTGFKGVSFHKDRGKYVAQIMANRKIHYLGYFDDPEKAYEAYCNAAEKLHGEYARVA